MNKEIINGAIKITDDSFYLAEDNLVKAFSPYALIVALNELFKAEIDPIHSKVSATGRSVVRVAEDTQWQEAGFGYKGLFAFLKDNLNIPIDTDKSFARTTSCWYVYLQDSYKEAFKKMLASEGNEVDNSQAKQENSEKSNKQTNNNEEVNINEENDWTKEKEDSAGNEPDCNEAGMQQDQEGTQDESGAPDVPADSSGTDGVQGLGGAAKEEPKPKQTRARKPKKA